MYYLEYYNTIVAEVDIENKHIEIIKPDLFFDRYNKVNIAGEEFDRWVNNRVRPQSQRGFNDFVNDLGLDLNSPTLNLDILIKTRALNAKDKLWLAYKDEEDYETCSPWYKILTCSSLVFESEADIRNCVSLKETAL